VIRIIFGTNNSLRARLIRWATKSKWSHVWIEYPSEMWGGWWAAHSAEDGVVKVPHNRLWSRYPKRTMYELDVPLDLGFEWARRVIGARYDYGVIWNALLLVLFRATRWEWLYQVVARNAARFSCSEFVAGFLKAAGTEGTEHWDVELMPPEALYRYMQKARDAGWADHTP
jgi:hypothetical protein